MNRDKAWLENKIQNLNEWLERHDKRHNMYTLKTHNRDYYVNRLIELEENNLQTVKI